MSKTNTPAPDASNVVLYQMMMHYKRVAELESEEVERLKEEREVHATEMAGMQERLHTEIIGGRAIRAANVRGAMMVMRKHDAGMRLTRCIDELFDAIELIHQTQMSFAPGMEYLKYEKDRIQQRATTAFELLIREHDELEADEEIDLTGDTTEEEGEEEEVEI